MSDELVPVNESNFDLEAMMREREKVAKAMGLTIEEFSAYSVKDRDAVLFILLKETATNFAYLNDRVSACETEVRMAVKQMADAVEKYTSPEGLQELVEKFTSGGGFGGLLGGMFG